MPSSVLLITSHWTPFGLSLAHRLVPSSANHNDKLVVLCPFSARGVPRSLLEEAERGTVQIEFGRHGNERSVAKLVQQHQIRAVFLLLVDDECQPPNSEAIATRTRALLRPLCALLECLRQCDSPPTLCVCDSFAEGHPQPRAVVQCASEASARFSSVCALLHAFSVSYRLNVQIILIEERLDSAQKRDKAAEFVMEKAEKGGEKAPIHPFKMSGHCDGGAVEKEEELIPCAPYARLLLFGTPSAIQSAQLAQLRALVPGAQLTVANCRPGLDTDEAVEEEIVALGASHLVFVHGADGETRDAWEAGGPANLRENVRVNLFSPWLLSNICDRFGILFIEFDGEDKNCCNSNGKVPTNADALQMSRYAVVRHFGEKLCQMKVHAE
ncbi:hypothetical protein niasHS_001325 [Heterodera schachtii]|uniref:Uncharacterized protein n=1 Tax=Heterodera schachtii TaxID=97005 RepID=A0ABD2KIT8_HETSC